MIYPHRSYVRGAAGGRIPVQGLALLSLCVRELFRASQSVSIVRRIVTQLRFRKEEERINTSATTNFPVPMTFLSASCHVRTSGRHKCWLHGCTATIVFLLQFSWSTTEAYISANLLLLKVFAGTVAHFGGSSRWLGPSDISAPVVPLRLDTVYRTSRTCCMHLHN